MNKVSEMTEIKPTGKIDPKLPKPSMELIEKVPVYKRNGFKRITGSIIMVIGGALSLFPKTSLLGQGLFYAGGALLGVGAADAVRKSNVNGNQKASFIMGFLQKVIGILKFKK